ncbi:hypothetical protein TNCV_3119841 [Trichonephila clavipes]|uniref:Uncharacterized protein n=1 Tax=Trichonephila clavipes TaxID=2585209 RepID=A0A8X6WAF1_TRICX|nr:hypothetical protein TNCV_3119841 [Trichonephila clavipes]
MLDVFFGIQGIVHLEFVPDERTVKCELYEDILSRLRELIRNCGLSSYDALLRHNAPAHRSYLVIHLLAKKKTYILPHPP